MVITQIIDPKYGSLYRKYTKIIRITPASPIQCDASYLITYMISIFTSLLLETHIGT